MRSWTWGAGGWCRRGPPGRGGEKGKKGKKKRRKKEGRAFRVPGDLLFCTPEVADAHLGAALEERDDGDDGEDEGDEGYDKGEGGDKGGQVGGEKGGEKEGDKGGEKVDAGSKDAPGNPHHARGVTCLSRPTKGGLGGRGASSANRANRANPPPSEPALAGQVTFQVTFGVGLGG